MRNFICPYCMNEYSKRKILYWCTKCNKEVKPKSIFSRNPFVFNNKNKQTGWKFIIGFIIYTVLSASLVMLINKFGVSEEYCKLIVTPIMIIENYLVNKFWVFKK